MCVCVCVCVCVCARARACVCVHADMCAVILCIHIPTQYYVHACVSVIYVCC